MTSSTAAETSRFRLPTTVRPLHYDLTLEVDLAGAAFVGAVAVRVDVAEPVSEVVLNADDLDIVEAWVETPDGPRIDATVSTDTETERATLALQGELGVGTASVHLRFGGILNDKLVGFYRTTYKDPEGNEQVAAATQFEAPHARMAFPCWDEPEFKATFGITLVVPEGELAISNSAETERLAMGDGRVRYRFADTMVMSTYLVAFVVGPFEATEAVDVGGTPLRIVYPKGQGHLVGYGLEAGEFGLRFLSDYYGIPYPGDKIDLVAVPDFAFGAMENLGCITFREVLLLVDPKAVTQPELQRVADVIFHELAHMWFGDLVTMKWWNGLWLNEAFATFMEMKATDAFRPEWKRWVDFGLSRTMAFDTDALATTRPIEYEVISPADAEGMFDILTYEKGAAVLRMVEQYLGEEAFRAGVRRYLVEHAYGNTETSDLWDAIEAETGEPVRGVADSWIWQGGFPLVSASLSGTTLTLSQERFRYLEADAADAATEVRWMVPVIVAAGGVEHRVLIEGDSVTVDVAGADGSAPADVLVNAGGHGFYRVRYAGDLLGALTAGAQDHLAPIERYGLVDDTWASVLAGRTTAADFLALARGLHDDDDLSVWQRLAGALGTLSRTVEGDALLKFRAVVRDLAGPALDITGWEPAEGETERRRELRAALFGLLGTTGDDPGVQAKAAELHALALTTPEAVDPSLTAAALNVLASGGDAATYDQFLGLSETAPTPQEQRRYLYALADFPGDAEIDRTLARASDGSIRTQDAPYVINRALLNREQGPRVWAFLASHWDELGERFPRNTITRMVAGMTTFTDPALARDVASFFSEHPVPQGAKTLSQLLEKLAVTVALAEREGDRLGASLG